MIPAPGIGGKPSAISTGVVAGGIMRQKCFAPFPDPLLDQPQIEAVFAKRPGE